MKEFILLLTIAFLCAGCATAKKSDKSGKVLSDTRNPKVPPQQVEAAYNRNNPPGVSPPRAEPVANPTPNEGGYLLPGSSRVYFVAPYRDPFNPRIIHGDHVLIRAEEDPRPLLASASARRVIIGNAAVGDLHQAPAILDRELAEELGRDRQQREAMQKLLADTGDVLDEAKRENSALMRAFVEQLAYSKQLQEALKEAEDAKKEKLPTPKQPETTVPARK